MSDIVERLRSSIPDWHGGVTIYGQAADCIESLRQQLSIAEANQLNIEETHKITLREVQRESMRLQTENDSLRQQLAAAQAREQQLREALYDTNDFVERNSNRWDGITGKHPCVVVEASRAALALPQDTSALEAMIAKAGEVMRERAACKLDWILAAGGKTQGDVIRALPGVTLEDVK